MIGMIILCTDGSDVALRALKAGLPLLAQSREIVVVTVIEELDPMLVTGTGFAGGVMSPAEFERLETQQRREAQTLLDATLTDLGLQSASTKILIGHAGEALCRFAAESSASAIVMGTRGRGGVRRAMLGSVSDHVVRHAPCAVLSTAEHGHRGHPKTDAITTER